MKDDYIESKDLQNIKKALENAEIDYDELDDAASEIRLETENGRCFLFDSNGMLTGIM